MFLFLPQKLLKLEEHKKVTRNKTFWERYSIVIQYKRNSFFNKVTVPHLLKLMGASFEKKFFSK